MIENSKFNEITNLLRKSMRLINVSEKELGEILSLSFIKKFKKDDFIYQEENKVEYFYIIFEGKVEIFKYTDKFSKKTFGSLSKGDFFGIPELYEEKHIVNAFCLTDCEVALISKANFFEKIIKINSFLLDILRIHSRMIGEFQKTITLENAEIKVICYLNWLKQKSGKRKNDTIYIEKKQTHDKIANILLLSRETVTRILNSLKERKIIDFSNDYFVILDERFIEESSYNFERFAGFYGADK